MWHDLVFSTETIDNLKTEMQRLQDEGVRLLSEAKNMEEQVIDQNLNDFSYVFQKEQHRKESGVGLISRLCRELHY